MVTSATASEVLWTAQQDAGRAQARLEGREALTRFAVVFALIVFTLAAATVFARG